jgi:hypothetical protein
MSIREVKAWTLTCTGAYGERPTCVHRNIGPFFCERQSQVPLPEGWGYETVHDCGMTGYTAHNLWCGDCAKKYGKVLWR